MENEAKPATAALDTATFNAEAVRAFLFNQALQVAEGMKEQGAEHTDAVILTGSLEFAVQLWVQVSLRAGVPAQKAWQTLHSETRTLFGKHVELELAPVEPIAVGGNA